MDIKKSVPIAYCIICLLISSSIFSSAFLECYHEYQDNNYKLVTAAKIISIENIDSANGDHTLVEGQVGTEVYMHKIKDNACDIFYKEGDDVVYFSDIPLENLSYNHNEYEVLAGDKLNIYEYFLRIIGYSPSQVMNGFVGGTLEKKVYQYFYVSSILLIFDVLYVVYKIKSKKFEVVSLVMNAIMCTTSTFWVLINVLGIYFR